MKPNELNLAFAICKVSYPDVTFIDYGAIALRREVVASLPEGEALGLDAVQTDLARRGRLRALVAHERFFEIGSEAGLAELSRRLEAQ